MPHLEQRKIIKPTKKQENTTHSKEKNKSTENAPEEEQMAELATI